MEIQEYLKKPYPCVCGRVHTAKIRDVVLKASAIDEIGRIVKKYGYSSVFLIADQNTYEAAGRKTEQILKQERIAVRSHIFGQQDLIPDEAAMAELENAFPHEKALVLAVGSGTLNDLGRYFSFQRGLEYAIAGTAPSMDGYASTVAPMIVKGAKVTLEAQAPLAIIGDLDVLKEAPMHMIAAGVGDILGKYSSLCDWKLASIVKGEYYCESLVEIVKNSIETVVNNIGAVKRRKPEAVKGVMEGLILSGIAMSYAGNSRPASGSEHHMAHYWEMVFLREGKKPVLHGTKVGISTITVIKLYQWLLSLDIDFDRARRETTVYDEGRWQDEMRAAYQGAADGVLKLEAEIGKNRMAQVLSRISIMEEKWHEIRMFLESSLPEAEEVEKNLLQLDAPIRYNEVGINEQTFRTGVIAAKELRDRFGLLQMLFDLGLLKEAARRAE